MKQRIQVGADHGIPVVIGHHRKKAVLNDPGIVDQHVDVSRSLRSGIDNRLGPTCRTDIALDDGNRSWERSSIIGKRASSCIIVQIGGKHLRTAPGESEGYGPPDTAGTAGDDHDFIVKFHRYSGSFV